jgi:hypothetical protein
VNIKKRKGQDASLSLRNVKDKMKTMKLLWPEESRLDFGASMRPLLTVRQNFIRKIKRPQKVH